VTFEAFGDSIILKERICAFSGLRTENQGKFINDFNKSILTDDFGDFCQLISSLVSKSVQDLKFLIFSARRLNLNNIIMEDGAVVDLKYLREWLDGTILEVVSYLNFPNVLLLHFLLRINYRKATKNLQLKFKLPALYFPVIMPGGNRTVRGIIIGRPECP